MLGGSLTRYHTPTMQGKGFTQELIKLAGPSVVRSIGHGLQAYEEGASASEALKNQSQCTFPRFVIGLVLPLLLANPTT